MSYPLTKTLTYYKFTLGIKQLIHIVQNAHKFVFVT